MAQFLGILDIAWRGTPLDIDKGATMMLGGIKQNKVATSRGVGWSGEYEPSEITATVVFKVGMSLADLWAPGEGELQVTADTGQKYVFPAAFLTNRPKATGGDGGKIPADWGAGDWEELVNG